MAKTEKYKEEFQKKLKELEAFIHDKKAEIAELKEKAKDKKDDMELQEKIVNLEEKKDEAEKDLAELKGKAEENIEEAKGKLGKVFKKFGKKLDK
ncbi:MAG: hypothetical protein SCJ93_10120 [Bacillota bacterium]|nr:hypothetical protein [Bacillota bacterium]